MLATKSPSYLTTGELGDTLGVQAWRIARLFELGVVPEPQRIGGRRLIPKSLIPVLVDALRERGWLPAESAGVPPEAAP
jgi:hypothetical protein